MKKSKLFLTGIAILGIVGTGLAFKTKPYLSQFCVRAHNAPASANCTTQVQGQSLTSGGTLYYGVAKGSAACTSTTCSADLHFQTAE